MASRSTSSSRAHPRTVSRSSVPSGRAGVRLLWWEKRYLPTVFSPSLPSPRTRETVRDGRPGSAKIATRNGWFMRAIIRMNPLFHNLPGPTLVRTHGGAEIEGFISLEQMSAERFMRIKSSIGHDAPENLLLKAGLQLQTGIIGTRVASVPGVVMNSELLGIIPSAVVESLGWFDRIQILPNPTSAEPMEVSLMSRVKQRRTRPQRCCCKQEFQTTNYLLVCSATLVPDLPFSTKREFATAPSHPPARNWPASQVPAGTTVFACPAQGRISGPSGRSWCAQPARPAEVIISSRSR